MDRCQGRVYTGRGWDRIRGRQCTRKIWKDGYCKIHHPDSEEKRRNKSIEREEEKYKAGPIYIARIMKAEVERLRLLVIALGGNPDLPSGEQNQDENKKRYDIIQKKDKS